jgi:hypothetical protein
MPSMALRLALVCALVVGALGAAPAGARERPIVYVVVLDGLDGDKVEQGRAPYISSLLDGTNGNGTYFPNSSSVIPAETNPNHTAMMSGAYPGRSGIAANAFALYAPLESEDSCLPSGPEDFGVLPTETSGESASCPQAELLFESIRRQGNPDELATAGVFGKPKLGRIFAGSNYDPSRRDLDYLWAPCASGADDDDYCGSVATNPISGYAIDDATVMDQVLATAADGVVGDGGLSRPDLTFVNLHQIDTAGHATGTGPVYDTAIGLADDQVERLAETLKARGEWDRSVLILVSDHSMEATPSKVVLTDVLTGAGIPESEFLAVDNGSIDLIYLRDRLSRARYELLARMRAAILATDGVGEVLYREPNPADGGQDHTVAAVHPGWHSAGERSGDLLVVAEPNHAFSESSAGANPLPGNHGAPHTADNFLAITGGGELVRTRSVTGKGRSANPVNVDVAPTVMGLLGLFPPANSKGRFLRPAFDRRALREVARPHAPRIKLKGSRASFLPAGGRYDVEARAGGHWQRVATSRARPFISVRGLPEGATKIRVRGRSAAGIKSGWRMTKVR